MWHFLHYMGFGALALEMASSILPIRVIVPFGLINIEGNEFELCILGPVMHLGWFEERERLVEHIAILHSKSFATIIFCFLLLTSPQLFIKRIQPLT